MVRSCADDEQDVGSSRLCAPDTAYKNIVGLFSLTIHLMLATGGAYCIIQFESSEYNIDHSIDYLINTIIRRF